MFSKFAMACCRRVRCERARPRATCDELGVENLRMCTCVHAPNAAGTLILAALRDSAAKASMSAAVNRVCNIENVDSETTRFEWVVGSLSKYQLGDKVTSSSVSAGAHPSLCVPSRPGQPRQQNHTCVLQAGRSGCWTFTREVTSCRSMPPFISMFPTQRCVFRCVPACRRPR